MLARDVRFPTTPSVKPVKWMRLAVTIALALFVVISVALAPPADIDRAEAIGSRIRCPVCAGEPIADSPASLARDMMGLVRQGVAAGLDDNQIIDSVTAAYGADAQVLDPAVSPATLALWGVPGLVLVGGVVLGVGRLRRNPDHAES
jgi:cytochrome c-type biogenesis protein CcmH